MLICSKLKWLEWHSLSCPMQTTWATSSHTRSLGTSCRFAISCCLLSMSFGDEVSLCLTSSHLQQGQCMLLTGLFTNFHALLDSCWYGVAMLACTFKHACNFTTQSAPCNDAMSTYDGLPNRKTDCFQAQAVSHRNMSTMAYSGVAVQLDSDGRTWRIPTSESTFR